MKASSVAWKTCEGSGFKPQILFLLQRLIAQADSEWVSLHFPCGQRRSYSYWVYKQALPLVSFPCNSIHVHAFKLCLWVWTKSTAVNEAGSLLSPLQHFLRYFEMMEHTVLSVHYCSLSELLSLLMHQETKHIGVYRLHKAHTSQSLTCWTIHLMFSLLIVTGWQPRIHWHLHRGFSTEHCCDHVVWMN